MPFVCSWHESLLDIFAQVIVEVIVLLTVVVLIQRILIDQQANGAVPSDGRVFLKFGVDLCIKVVGLLDLLLALGGDVAPYAARATEMIPIVFLSSADPVRLGLAASLARPSHNATGVTLLLDDTASKRLELIKEAAPRVRRTAFLWNPDHPDNELLEAQRAAPALGLELHPVEMRGPNDLEGALRTMSDARPDALYVVSSRHTVLSIPRIMEFAQTNRIPVAGGWGAWARAGGLLSFGPNVNEMARRTAEYVDKVLKGAKPAELPIQQPTKFELVINVKAGKAMGIDVPPTLLARADEVIE